MATALEFAPTRKFLTTFSSFQHLSYSIHSLHPTIGLLPFYCTSSSNVISGTGYLSLFFIFWTPIFFFLAINSLTISYSLGCHFDRFLANLENLLLCGVPTGHAFLFLFLSPPFDLAMQKRKKTPSPSLSPLNDSRVASSLPPPPHPPLLPL
jgi:hypothetical protein